jgi:integrase
VERFGSLRLTDINPALITQARDEVARTRGPGTCNRLLNALSALYNTCAKRWFWVEGNPARGVQYLREPPGRDRILTPEERSALLAACRASNTRLLYPAVVLSLATGGRKMEILMAALASSRPRCRDYPPFAHQEQRPTTLTADRARTGRAV